MARVTLERKTDWRLIEDDQCNATDVMDFLSRTIWKSKDTQAYFRWKYQDNPQGKTMISAVVNSDNKVVGVSFFMPWLLSARAKTIGAYQWVDMYIDRKYRGQAISKQQLHSCRLRSRSEGNSICFAFPNNNGVAVHKENDGILLGGIFRYVKPLDYTYLVSRFCKQKVLATLISRLINFIFRFFSRESLIFRRKNWIIEEVSDIDEDYDVFWDAYRKKYSNKIMTHKTRSYMNWKFLQSPAQQRKIFLLRKENNITGVMVLEEAGNIGGIIDIFALSQKEFYYLAKYAITHFRRLGKDSVNYVALEKNMHAQQLGRFGFRQRPYNKCFYF